MTARRVVAARAAALVVSLAAEVGCVGGGCVGASAASEVALTPALVRAVPLSLPTAAETVLAGAGDIASCDSDDDELTAILVERVLGAASPQSRAFTAGDNVYPAGSQQDYRDCYLPTRGDGFSRRRCPWPATTTG